MASQAREEERMQRLLTQAHSLLFEHLYAEGFLNCTVSFYPGYELHSDPEISRLHVQRQLSPFISELRASKRWLAHVSFVMTEGISRASYETHAGTYWTFAEKNFAEPIDRPG